MATLSELVQRTVTRLSMVAGVGVQVYAEDRLAEMIQHKFTIVRDELWWDDMMTYVTLTQGADGRPIENVVRMLPTVVVGDEVVINKYKDVQHAWHPNQRDPLKSYPRRNNPAAIMRTGRTAFMMPDSAKVVRFCPHEAGTVMTVRVKQFYGTFEPTDEVPMDDQLLILGAAYDYLEDDGSNPGQTEKFRNLFNDRLRQLKSQENEAAIPLHPLSGGNVDGFQVVG